MSIKMSTIELDGGWSFYYVHCTLKLAPTTLQFKRSHIEIEYNKHKTDSPMRRTNKFVSLLYLLYKAKIGMYLN